MREPATPDDRRLWIGAALERHERDLVGYALRLLDGDLERARDVVQDVFLRLCEVRPRDVDGHLRQWLFRVTRNRALDVRRKEDRMTDLTDEDAHRRGGDPAATTAAVDLEDEAQSVLAHARELPAKQHEVLRLKFQHGLSYREIAGVMGETVGTVGWLVHAGIRGLRERLDGKGVPACDATERS